MTSFRICRVGADLGRGLAAVTLSILLAACSSTGAPPTPAGPTAPSAASGSATPSPTPAPTEPAPTTVVSTPTVTPIPTTAVSATPGPTPTVGGDIDLLALLPTEIGGNKMTLEPASDPAQSFLILWFDEQIARDLLASLGRSEKDVSIVFSYASDAKYPESVAVNAYRVAGADGVALRDGMVNEYVKYLQAANPTVTPMRVGGKDTVALSTKNAPAGAGEYYYAYGDIVFNVTGNPPAWVEDALSKLP